MVVKTCLVKESKRESWLMLAVFSTEESGRTVKSGLAFLFLQQVSANAKIVTITLVLMSSKDIRRAFVAQHKYKIKPVRFAAKLTLIGLFAEENVYLIVSIYDN